jgi:radical SAM superfamily enzyme YgiQ (UPF0313 family)
MKTKILLIGINARFTHSNPAIRYIRNAVSDMDYDVLIKEYSINQSSLEILQSIYAQIPDIIAISVYIWNSDLVKKLLPDIKKILTHSKLILGGPEVNYVAQNWITAFPEIDCIISGYGESAFRRLAEDKFKTKKKIISQPNPPFRDIPFPYVDDDFPILNKKYIYYESSRGCSFRCSYCLSSRMDQKLEFRDIEQVKRELNWLLEKNIRIIKFVDRTFNFDPEFSREIWSFLIEKETDMKFHFEIRPDLLQEADFELLKKCPTDRFQFEIGIQTTNNLTLKAIHRFQSWKKIAENVHRLKQFGSIHLHVDLIAGLPFEDRNSLINSFNDIISLEAEHFQVGFLKVLPGTEMQEKAEEFKLVFQQHPPYQVLKTKWLTMEDLIDFMQIDKLVNSIYNSGNFKTTYSQVVSMFTSPYQFFETILHFCKIQRYDLNLREWQKVAEYFIKFVEKEFSDFLDFFRDCLRWDWCSLADSHYYPPIINCSQTRAWKSSGFVMLQNETNSFGFRTFQINRAIFLKPTTILFREKMNLENSIYAFIKSENKIKIIELKK